MGNSHPNSVIIYISISIVDDSAPTGNDWVEARSPFVAKNILKLSILKKKHELSIGQNILE